MSEKVTFVIILSSIHHVLKGEKVLLRSGLEFDLIPVPKEINPDCGMAIETGLDNAPHVVRALTGAGLTVEGFYRRTDSLFQETALPH